MLKTNWTKASARRVVIAVFACEVDLLLEKNAAHCCVSVVFFFDLLLRLVILSKNGWSSILDHQSIKSD